VKRNTQEIRRKKEILGCGRQAGEEVLVDAFQAAIR